MAALLWFRNKRRKGRSQWHADAGDHERLPIPLPALAEGISMCHSTLRASLEVQTSEDQPGADVCPHCIREIGNRKQIPLAIEEGPGRLSDWWTDEAAEQKFRRASAKR
jgi:hypothetical protein